MPDPALLLLMHHLTRPAPAITEVAPAGLTVPGAAAYETYISEQETELTRWIAQGESLRERLWREVQNDGSGLTLEILSGLIARFELGLRVEAKTLARKEKRAARDEKWLPADHRPVIASLHRRLLGLGRRYYDEALDFAAFLRALRAEMNAESRGGAVYDNPASLERDLLAALRSA